MNKYNKPETRPTRAQLELPEFTGTSGDLRAARTTRSDHKASPGQRLTLRITFMLAVTTLPHYHLGGCGRGDLTVADIT